MDFQASGNGSVYAMRPSYHKTAKKRKEVDTQSRRIAAAALLGQGYNADQVAKQLGCSASLIHKLKQDIKTDPDMKEIMQVTYRQQFARARPILERAMEAQEKGIELYMEHAGTATHELAPTLRDVTNVTKVLGEHFLLKPDAPDPVVKTKININARDPKTIAAIFQYMRGEKQDALDATIDVTPPKET